MDALRSRSRRPWIPANVIAVALLMGLPAAASAHEKGVLTVSNRVLVAGDTVVVTGAKFEPGGTLALALVGARGRVSLGGVHADTSGAFHSVLHVPDALERGSYRLVATAEDGDEAGALDVAVVPWTPATSADTAKGRAGPSDEPLALPRARSLLTMTIEIVGIVLALVLGVALLRRPAGAG